MFEEIWQSGIPAISNLATQWAAGAQKRLETRRDFLILSCRLRRNRAQLRDAECVCDVCVMCVCICVLMLERERECECVCECAPTHEIWAAAQQMITVSIMHAVKLRSWTTALGSAALLLLLLLHTRLFSGLRLSWSFWRSFHTWTGSCFKSKFISGVKVGENHVARASGTAALVELFSQKPCLCCHDCRGWVGCRGFSSSELQNAHWSGLLRFGLAFGAQFCLQKTF